MSGLVLCAYDKWEFKMYCSPPLLSPLVLGCVIDSAATVAGTLLVAISIWDVYYMSMEKLPNSLGALVPLEQVYRVWQGEGGGGIYGQ
jgi:hypothetical protein